MQFTEPIIGPMPEPPGLPDDTETGLLRLAQLRAFGSPEVHAAVLRFQQEMDDVPCRRRHAPRTTHATRRRCRRMDRVQGEREDASRRLDHVADLINAELATP